MLHIQDNIEVSKNLVIFVCLILLISKHHSSKYFWLILKELSCGQQAVIHLLSYIVADLLEY